jgi:tRNA pseudouridine55 synthase
VQEKEYTGTFTIGTTTPSFDLEKPVDAHFPYAHITLELAQRVAQTFVGEIAQVPPLYSAVRIAGRRAFSYAREGQELEIEPKNIVIHSFEITRFALPEIDFRVICSKGTYIRSLARDFGLALDSGAHLSALRRTRIGNFRVEEAIKL